MGNWNQQHEEYSLEKTGETEKGWWFNDGCMDEDIFLPESVTSVLERQGPVWLVSVPNWLAKQKGLI
jgi:hypothetical protein